MNPFLHGARKGKGNIYLHKGKGKSRRDKREKGKSTPLDLAEISLDQAPRARTYARTARHETISRLRGACRTHPPTSDIYILREFLFNSRHPGPRREKGGQRAAVQMPLPRDCRDCRESSGRLDSMRRRCKMDTFARNWASNFRQI